MTSSAATSVNFSAGSLIIPMDTDTSGNHASYNQNTGMWKSYGLLYRLLQNGIPVRWAIKRDEDREQRRRLLGHERQGQAHGHGARRVGLRGGPFIVESAYAAAALPIIQAFWAAQGNQPNVHEAQARSPPTCA